MATRDLSLNAVQLEVLAWVRDGCPVGVYEDWSHRITARALHNRGLIRVTGRGAFWTAMIAPSGSYYLEHGGYPPPQDSAGASHSDDASQFPKVHSDEVPPSAPRTKPRTQKHKRGVTEVFLEELVEAAAAGLEIPADRARLLRRRVLDAEQRGRIPEGKRIAVRPFRRAESHGAHARLESAPRWFRQAQRVRRRRSGEHTTPAMEFSGSEGFRVKGQSRERALYLVDALVGGAETEGMTVRTVLGAHVKDHRRQAEARRDELAFANGPDEVRLWFVQETIQVRHEPTERELARARQGYLFPDFDDVPDENLAVVVGGGSGAFWGSSWKDSEDHRLEQLLPRMLEEVLFQLDAHAAMREAERFREEATLLELEQRREAWDRAHERALEAFHRKFLLNEMLDQADAWQRAGELRRYAAAVRRQAQTLEGGRRAVALDWAERIEAQADGVDPLPHRALAPELPRPSNEDLKPFMGKHGLWRP